MKHLFYFLEAMLLALLCSFNASGQNNFVPGYFINNSGDTIKCDVNFQDWETNPDHVTVKLNEKETKVYYPKDIRGFFIHPDQRYRTLTVTMDCMPHTVGDIMDKKEGKIVADTTVFLQLLAQGKMSLYYFQDINGKQHFYTVLDGQKPLELTVKKTLGINETPDNYGTYVSVVNTYKGQLKVQMEDCPSISEKAMKTDYNEYSLQRLVNSYNTKCGNGEGGTFVKSEAKVKFKFGLTAGVDMIMIDFVGFEEKNINKVKFPPAYSFMAGGVFNIFLPKNLSRISIVNELVVKPYNATSDPISSTTVLLPWKEMVDTYNVEAVYLKLNTMARYSFSNWKVNPFINAGVSNGYAVKLETNDHETTYSHGQIESETDQPIMEDTRKYEFGALAGLGASFYHFSAEVRYEWSNGMSPYNTLTCNINTFYFLLSYTF